MKDKSFKVVGANEDFTIIPNYVIQMMAEGTITHIAMCLYLLYKSFDGFNQIFPGMRYISANSKLSLGSISNANKILEKAGLIKIKKRGPNVSNEIFIRSTRDFPRRVLKNPRRENQEEDQDIEIEFEPLALNAEEVHRRIEEEQLKNDGEFEPFEYEDDEQYNSSDEQAHSPDEQPVHETNTRSALSSPDERIQTQDYTDKELNRKSTTRDEKSLFIKEFKEYWCKMNKTDKYRIADLDSADEIDNFSLARKLIPVLWSLDETDHWVKRSNHSLKVFVKEYVNGNLQSIYPKTEQYYKDKNKLKLNT